jgi:hypothetical protein
MDTATKASLIQEGGKLLSDGIRLLMAKPKTAVAHCEERPAQVVNKPAPSTGLSSPPAPAVVRTLPTRDETTHELKRRLARELYRAELDLAGGLKIAGKACDCLEYKHSVGLEAAAEELISQDPGNPVYKEIVQWTKDNLAKVTVEAIQSGKYDADYPRMALQFKEFRKRVVGTSETGPRPRPAPTMTLEEAKKMAADQAAAEVERKWNSVGKK